jgi:integrase
MASHWASATRLGVAKAYGRFISFLGCAGWLPTVSTPPQRITPDRIAAFILHLENQVSPISVWSLVSHLCMAVKVMFPERDWSWLQQVVNRLRRRVTPAKPGINRILPTRKLWKSAIMLMDETHKADNVSRLLKASRYRDGLMLALQAARPLRLKNLTSLDVDRHLKRVGNAYVVTFEAGEMKNHSAFETMLPIALTLRIDSYLMTYRPVLLEGNRSSALWITKQGRPMRPFSVHQRITRLTRRMFGTAMSVHRFRHASATAIAVERPEKVRMAMALLGHRQFSTTDRYYIAGQSLTASRAHNSLIEGLKRTQTKKGQDK